MRSTASCAESPSATSDWGSCRRSSASARSLPAPSWPSSVTPSGSAAPVRPCARPAWIRWSEIPPRQRTRRAIDVRARESLRRVYGDLVVDISGERVTGPHAYHKFAVVAGDGDRQTMLNDAAIQAVLRGGPGRLGY